MPKTPQSPFEDSEKQRSVSRRELMKIIGAMGGTLAVTSLIPDKWLPPEIAVGVLPAHAQTSDGLTVSNVQIDYYLEGAGSTSGEPVAGNGYVHFLASMQFLDPLQMAIQGNSQVLGKYPGPSGSDVSCAIVNMGPPYAMSGSVWFHFNVQPLTNSTAQFYARLRCTAPSVRTSNESPGNLPPT